MTATTHFRGSFTALVTPFKNGTVDEQMFRDLVEWQIAEGTHERGIVNVTKFATRLAAKAVDVQHARPFPTRDTGS